MKNRFSIWRLKHQNLDNCTERDEKKKKKKNQKVPRIFRCGGVICIICIVQKELGSTQNKFLAQSEKNSRHSVYV